MTPQPPPARPNPLPIRGKPPAPLLAPRPVPHPSSAPTASAAVISSPQAACVFPRCPPVSPLLGPDVRQAGSPRSFHLILIFFSFCFFLKFFLNLRAPCATVSLNLPTAVPESHPLPPFPLSSSPPDAGSFLSCPCPRPEGCWHVWPRGFEGRALHVPSSSSKEGPKAGPDAHSQAGPPAGPLLRGCPLAPRGTSVASLPHPQAARGPAPSPRHKQSLP